MKIAPRHKIGLKTSLMILSIIFTVVACAEKKAERNISPGRAFFVGFGCLKCHSIGNEGGKAGPDLSFIGFRKNSEWLDKWIKNPHDWKKDTIMPNFHLEKNIRSALVDYLSSLRGESFSETSYPWNARELIEDPIKRGEVIFNRVGCVGCHGRAGKGGYPNNNVFGGKIPALIYVADGYTKEEMKEKIRKGVKPAKADPNGPNPLIFMPPWGEVLLENEIDAVAEYILSLRPPLSEEDEW